MDEPGEIRTYDLDECIAFSLPRGAWGALSNFSAGFAVRINGEEWATTEHLYQACRFPHLPDLQARIRANPSPHAAKMRAHKHEDETRPDWEMVRVPIMCWCLAVKLAQHHASFGSLLLTTGTQVLVEVSGDDAFWGAVPDGRGARSATGANRLGKLLMAARAMLSMPVRSEADDCWGTDAREWVPAPPRALGLQLLGQVIVGERAGDHEQGV